MKRIEIEYFKAYLKIADDSLNTNKPSDILHKLLDNINAHYLQEGLPLSKIKKTLPSDNINVPLEWNAEYEGWITSQVC